MHSLHLSASKPWRKTELKLMNSDFGVNIECLLSNSYQIVMRCLLRQWQPNIPSMTRLKGSRSLACQYFALVLIGLAAIYRIIVAVLSVIERLGDILISWVPLYAEMKLAFIIYLWYPKTKGTSYVYESLLRPFVVKHETDIERNLQALRLRAWDLAIYYMQNCTELGQSAFFEVVHYVANQSARLKGVSTQKNEPGQPRGPPPPPPPPTPLHWLNNESVVSSPRHPKNNTGSSSPKRGSNNPKVTRRWLPSAPPMPPTLFRSQAPPPKSKVVQVEPTEAKTEYVQHIEEELKAEGGGPEAVESPIPNDNPIRIHLGRIIRLRRSKGQ